MILHLSIWVWWNPSCTKNILLNHFVYPYERKTTIVCYAQLYRQMVEVEWLESARDTALSIDGGPMWFSKMIEILA
jgi:hypothetical protein